MALPEAIRKRIASAQQKIGNSGVKWLTLESGKPVDIHIIFGEYGSEKLWYLKQGIHYLGEGKTQQRVTCPRITSDADCPICELTKTLKDEISAKKRDLDANRKTMTQNEVTAAEGDIQATEELADSFYVSIRYVFNVVVKGESTVRLFNCPKTIFEEIFAIWAKNGEQVDMFDPKNSFYFTVLRTGQGQNDTRYTVTPNMLPLPLAPNQESIDKLVASRHDLDAEIKVPTYAEVKEIFDKYLGGDTSAAAPASSKPAEQPKVADKPAPQTASTPATQAGTTTAGGEMSAAARLRQKLSGGAATK